MLRHLLSCFVRSLLFELPAGMELVLFCECATLLIALQIPQERAVLMQLQSNGAAAAAEAAAANTSTSALYSAKRRKVGGAVGTKLCRHALCNTVIFMAYLIFSASTSTRSVQTSSRIWAHEATHRGRRRARGRTAP